MSNHSRSAPSELEDIAATRFNNMRRRFAARYTKDGRLYRPGLALPFTLNQFTAWLRTLLQGGTTRCVYCDWPVNLHTMHLDHRTPVSQGGSLDLDNLAPTCASCNQVKGALSEAGFLQLRVLLSQLNPHDAADIRGRLQSQLKLAFREQRRLGRSPSPSVRIVPHRREAC